MKKLKDYLIICFDTILIIITFILLGNKLYHAHMVDKAAVAILNGYTVKIEDHDIGISDAIFMSTTEISKYNINVDNNKKIVELN